MRRSLEEIGLLAGEALVSVRRTVALALSHSGPSLSQLYHSVHNGNGHSTGHSRSNRTRPKPVRCLFLQGWFAPSHAVVYQPLINRLHAAGLEVVANPLSWWAYHFSDLNGTEEKLGHFVVDQEIACVIGHSLGGLAAAHISTLHHVPFVAIASPLNDTPIGLLHYLVATGLRISEKDSHRRLTHLRQKIKADRRNVPFLTISGDRDVIAPRRSCDLGRPHHHVKGNHVEIVENPEVSDILVDFAHSLQGYRRAA